MKQLIKSLTFVALALVATVGCSTTGRFNLPPDTTLQVTDRQVQLDGNNEWKTSPFFWSETGGADYQLKNKDGKVIRRGKLKTHFRVWSIFWPPFALIYWPMGLHDHGFDLTKPGDGYYVVDTQNSGGASVSDEAAPAPTEAAPAAKPAKKKKK